MTIYILMALMSALLAYTLNVRSAAHVDFKRMATYLPLMPYLVIAISRFEVGKDTVGELSTYPRVFRLVQSQYSYTEFFQIQPIEPLYYAANWLAFNLGLEISAVYVLMSTIFLGFMYIFIIERSSNIPLSLLLLFASDLYLFGLSGIRQAAACGIAFYATRYAIQRRPIPYLAWIAVATGFHFTAILFVPIYLIANRRITAPAATVVAITAAGLTLVPDQVRRLMGAYYGATYFGGKWDYANFNLAPAITMAVIALAILACFKFIHDPSMNIFINICIANLFLMSISSLLITPIRLYYLLIPATFVLVPAIITSIPARLGAVRLLTSTLLIGALSLQLVYEMSMGNDAYGTWQYKSIFDSTDV